jgi:hypothetical protein
MDLKGIAYEAVDWMQLAQNKVQLCERPDMMLNIRSAYNARKFLKS